MSGASQPVPDSLDAMRASASSESVDVPADLPETSERGPYKTWDAGFRLVLLVIVAFQLCVGNEFVQWDDPINFLSNRDFQGFGFDQIRWAWTTTLLGVYQPLAWMLLSLQSALWGLKPSGYHLVSLILHACVAVVLGLVLQTLTARARPDWWAKFPRAVSLSAWLTAALFAVHPLRVEVVAWVSCQPYLPCALFGLLMIYAYLRAYPEGGGWDKQWYALSVGLYLAALLSKAVAVGLGPCLLLLDLYPLRILGGEAGWRTPQAMKVYLAKVPFAALCLGFLVIAYYAKNSEEVFVPLGNFGVAERIAQAGYGYAFYLEKTIWPVDITMYYPVPPQVKLEAPRFAIRVIAVVLITVMTLVLWKRTKAFFVAWFSYLIILAPNVGIARIGDQLAADRYSYLSTIGLTALFAGGLTALLIRYGGSPAARAGLTETETDTDTANLPGETVDVGGGETASATASALPKSRQRRRTSEWETDVETVTEPTPGQGKDSSRTLILMVVAVIGVLTGLTMRQSGIWKDSYALWSHAYAHGAQENAVVKLGLGLAVSGRGETDNARRLYEEAIALRPEQSRPHVNLGLLHFARGDWESALAELEQAVKLKPESSPTRRTYGYMLMEYGRFDEAYVQLEAATLRNPEMADAQFRFGVVLERLQREDEARAAYMLAVAAEPDDPGYRFALGRMLLRQGRYEEAAAQFVAANRPETAVAPRYWEGFAHALQGNTFIALERWLAITRDYPHNSRARDSLAKILDILGQTEPAKAQRAWAEALVNEDQKFVKRDFPLPKTP